MKAINEIYIMSNPYFKFKQFTVWHDKCAMKVGTDGVLLGVWAQIKNAKNVLDVGTGTGLIALLLAQRNANLQIKAIEIDQLAALQAEENVKQSPWADRIEVLCQDFRTFSQESRLDLIISNPPYFIDALRCPDRQRSTARHTCELNYELLFSKSVQLLQEKGRISIIIPVEVEKKVIATAWKYGLFPIHGLRVFTMMGKPCRRVLLSFEFQEKEYVEEKLHIRLNMSEYTDEYRALMHEYYLRF